MARVDQARRPPNALQEAIARESKAEADTEADFAKAFADMRGEAGAGAGAGAGGFGAGVGAAEESKGGDTEPETPDFDLERTARSWSDFIKVQLHPSSGVPLPRVSPGTKFDVYSHGTATAGSEDSLEEMVDPIRRVIECSDGIEV